MVAAAGLALAGSLLALHSYFTLTAAIQSQGEVVSAAGWPADGWLTTLDALDPAEQNLVAGAPGVAECAFTAMAPVKTSTGTGWVQGIDFHGPFFSLTLKTGTLPGDGAEAVVDSAYARVAGVTCGDIITVTVPSAAGGTTVGEAGEMTVDLRVVGILAPDAVAPRGALVSRDYCLSSLGGRLCRAWIRTADPGQAPAVLADLSARVALSYYETVEDWVGQPASAASGSYDLLGAMVIVLSLAALIVLWVLAQFSVSHNAALLRTAHALGVRPTGLVLLLALEGLVAGAVAAAALASVTGLAGASSALGAFEGCGWTVPVGLLLPPAVTTVVGFGVADRIERGFIGG